MDSNILFTLALGASNHQPQEWKKVSLGVATEQPQQGRIPETPKFCPTGTLSLRWSATQAQRNQVIHAPAI